MFPYADAQSLLDIHHQRVAELIQAAAAYRLARTVSPSRHHHRFGRWPRRAPADRSAQRTAAA